jgi:hypothetical protein
LTARTRRNQIMGQESDGTSDNQIGAETYALARVRAERARYRDAWAAYRKATFCLWLTFFSYGPVGLLGVWLLSFVIAKNQASLIIWLLYIAIWFAAGLPLSRFRCPRCSGVFTAASGGRCNIFATKCCHCGLPLYARDSTF